MQDPIAKASIKGLKREKLHKTIKTFHIFQMTDTHSNKKNLRELDVLASESHKQHTTSSVRGKSQLIGQAL